MVAKVYVNPETSKVFSPATATANDVTFECDGLSNGAGRQSAQLDLGSAARSRRYAWRAFVQAQATPTVGDVLRVYLKTSDGTHPDNDDGTGDAAVSAEDKLRNLQFIGVIECDEAAANIEFVAQGEVEINARYVQIVFWNELGATLTTDVDENGLILTPVPDESQ